MTLLFSGQITAAGTYTSDAVSDLGAVKEAHLQCIFAYGSGGTTVDAYVQTSIDGTNFYDIACFAHAQTSLARTMCCIGAGVLTPVALTDGTLTDDTAINGRLGTLFRVKYIVAGTYAGNTTLAVRAAFKT
jgi:hypothetical protein